MAMSMKKAVAPAMRATGQQVRGMATEKQLVMRITSTSNIAKITKSMKMVSASKMRGAETRLNGMRPFAKWMDNADTPNRVIETDGLIPAEELADTDDVFVVVSSDRGLCGGVNSAVSKATRRQVGGIAPNKSIFVVGDKARAQLRRDYSPSIRGNITECYQTPPNFTVASAIAESILASASNKETERVHVVYNKYQSAISYLPSIRSVTLDPTNSDTFVQYEVEPDSAEEVLTDLREFMTASAVFEGMAENAASEESSRMAAMENATSNAEDLIQKLTLQYNKARQARITTELIEIISGATALDG